MEFAWLEDFIALADTGSFSRAAVRRHVTQPAFSRRIRALEQWTGVTLFDRTALGARLTPAGDRFARGVPLLIRDLAQLRREASAIGERAAPVRLAATHSLSADFFPAWLRQLEQAVATPALTLRSGTMQACEELMLSGEAQLLLCHGNSLAPDRLDGSPFRRLAIGTDGLIPLVAPDAAGDPRWRLDAEGAQPLLGYASDTGLGRILAAQEHACRAPGLVTVFTAALAATLLGMAREGRGIAWLPASLAAADVARGSLVAAGDDSWRVSLTIELIRPATRQDAAVEQLWSAATDVSAPPRSG